MAMVLSESLEIETVKKYGENGEAEGMSTIKVIVEDIWIRFEVNGEQVAIMELVDYYNIRDEIERVLDSDKETKE